MASKIRGADVVMRALDRAGLRTVFTLSGNHIMPLFDASLETDLKLIHVRHEAATVYMADAWARLTGQCGVAMVTGGAGHSNAVGALPTALASESPMILLSGAAGLNELGRGAFQELRQADMAAPATKASWTARSASTLGFDIADAVRIASSGRTGPVHLSLPFDLLDEMVEDTPELWPKTDAFMPKRQGLSMIAADAILASIKAAERPLVLTGPMLCHTPVAPLMAQLAEALELPVIGMESPRGINDPQLGAFAEVLARADLIVLLGKAHDFTLRFGEPPSVDAACRWIVVDPDPGMVGRVAREKGDRLILGVIADPVPVLERLFDMPVARTLRNGVWCEQVSAAISYRPQEWANLRPGDSIHPIELCRAIAAVLARYPNATLVSDGGEIGQWAQSLVPATRRVINGVAGSIGGGVPFAIAARQAKPNEPVIVGFHVSEFDTALRYGLPIVAVVGNDAGWNAEHQIQIRTYGRDRAHGCELLPTRYDRVVQAFGGYGEKCRAR